MSSPVPAFIVLALIASGYLWVAVKRSRIVEPEPRERAHDVPSTPRRFGKGL